MVIGSLEEFLSCTDIGFYHDELENTPLMCLKLLRELPKIEEASRGIITRNRLLYHRIYDRDDIVQNLDLVQDLANMLYNNDQWFYETMAIFGDKTWRLLSNLPAEVTLPDEIVDLILNFLTLKDIYSLRTV